MSEKHPCSCHDHPADAPCAGDGARVFWEEDGSIVRRCYACSMGCPDSGGRVLEAPQPRERRHVCRSEVAAGIRDRIHRGACACRCYSCAAARAGETA